MRTRQIKDRRLSLGLALLLAAACPLLLPLPGGKPAHCAAAQGPRATLQRLNGEVDRLLRKKLPADSPEEKAVKEQVKTLAGQLLDYGELTKRALGEHWDKMKPAQRTEFVHTLRDVIERNYVKQLRTNLNYTVVYGDEEIDGAEAKVTTTIKLQTKGKATDALIEYRMLKTKDSWMVYDVITDELSLVRNYRSQFQRIINQSGYDGLLDKMKKKAAEDKG